jgi:hypothetical protein
MTVVSVVITPNIEDGSPIDVSNDVMRIEAWPQATLGVVNFKITLRDTSGIYDGVFPADSAVTITLDNAVLWKGYVDIALPNVAQDAEHRFFETLEISGRNYGQDSQNKFYDQVYYDHADNIIADILSKSGCEITFTSSGSAPSIYYDCKLRYVSDAIREILELINYDGYVNNSKVWQMYAIGSVSSGITLKSVADALDNNIIRVIEHTEVDALDLHNYIVALGPVGLPDAWTELNASDWAPLFSGNVISDYTGTSPTAPQAGVAAIKAAKGSGSQCGAYLSFPRYNHQFLDFSLTPSAQISVQVYSHYNTPIPLPPPCVQLTDTDGNVIEWYPNYTIGGPAFASGCWNLLSLPIGYDQQVHEINQCYNAWYYVTKVTSFNWKITKIAVASADVTYVDYILIDALTVPYQMVAVNDQSAGTTYKVRKLPIDRSDITSQKELQQYADSIGPKMKNPIDKLSLVARGDIGLIGGVWKWLPGFKATVNIPAKNLNNANYRFINIHHIIQRHVEFGFDHVVELDMVPATQQLDMQRWTYATDPQIGIFRKLRDRLRYFEQKDFVVRDLYSGLPPPLGQKYRLTGSLSEVHGSAFPSNAQDQQNYYRDDLKMNFRYDAATGEWIPHSGTGAGTKTSAVSRTDDVTNDSYYSYTQGLAKAQAKTYFEIWRITYPAQEKIRYLLQECIFQLKCDVTGLPTAYGKIQVSEDGGSSWTDFGSEQWTTSTSWVEFTADSSFTGSLNTQLIVRFMLGGKNDDPMNTSGVGMQKCRVTQLGALGQSQQVV